MPNFKKARGFSLRSGNKPSMSSFKMMGSTTPSPITSPYKQTDWAKMQAESAKNDPRYGEMTPEAYKKEALRQSKSYKETGSYDANGTDKKEVEETPEEKETNVTETPAEGITEAVNNMEVPKVNKFKTAASKLGGVLTGAFTGGLDAVYGTGKVLKGGDISFQKNKKKKDDKTGEEKVDEIINKES